MLSLRIPENFKIMHCGILFTMPYIDNNTNLDVTSIRIEIKVIAVLFYHLIFYLTIWCTCFILVFSLKLQKYQYHTYEINI